MSSISPKSLNPLLRRRGPFIVPPPEAKNPTKYDYENLLVGKFMDDRKFEEDEIKAWVFSWSSRDAIMVWKEEDLFFLIFSNSLDYQDMRMKYDTLCYKGALLILKTWFLAASFKSFNFSEALLWVKIEGIPLVFNSMILAEIMFSKLGEIVAFDENAQVPGFKRWIRAKVKIRVSKPLIPGCFLEYKKGSTVWVDFRYEGVFNFCKRCGRIGHHILECTATWSTIKQNISESMVSASDVIIMYGPESSPLYTNKIRGLPNYEIFKTTRVQLGSVSPFPHFFSSDSSASNSGGGHGNNYFGEEGPSNKSLLRRKSIKRGSNEVLIHPLRVVLHIQVREWAMARN